MREVVLTYHSWISSHRYRVLVPQSWSELSSDQFLQVIRYILGLSSEAKLFASVLGIRMRLIKRIDTFLLYKLGELLSFLHDDHISLDHFIIPTIKSDRQTLYSPSVRLSDVSLQQFMSADTFFSFFVLTKRDEFLDKLVASLYLAKGETFVIRNNKSHLVDIDHKCFAIKKIPYAIRYAVFINWSFIKTWLGRLYPYMFPPGDSDTDKDKHSKPQAPDWLTLFDNFVGDNIPDMQAYQAMPCMDAFRIINRKIKENSKK